MGDEMSLERSCACCSQSESNIFFQSVFVNTASDDAVGKLVFRDGRLLGVLVRLDDEEHGPLRGHWFLEAGFGLLESSRHQTFSDLERAEIWLAQISAPRQIEPGPLSPPL